MHKLSNLRPGSLILKLKFHQEANMWFWEERQEESIAFVRKLIIVKFPFFFFCKHTAPRENNRHFKTKFYIFRVSIACLFLKAQGTSWKRG